MGSSWSESSSSTGKKASGAPRSQSAILAHTVSSTSSKPYFSGGGGAPPKALTVPYIAVDVVGMETLIGEADSSCISATDVEVAASFSSLVAPCVDNVSMAFMISHRMGSIWNVVSDEFILRRCSV